MGPYLDKLNTSLQDEEPFVHCTNSFDFLLGEGGESIDLILHTQYIFM